MQNARGPEGGPKRQAIACETPTPVIFSPPNGEGEGETTCSTPLPLEYLKVSE